ncbi:hypothetical protein CVT24_006184 [Panaeolus cyanescens]|uniref:Zn(2)-C6 fungal-type domain-containing protein n=1 Tax=Panaeolus cyanescens TaxID=181874 RepID=A0A409V8N9_9AGAR|nr:hypothetical protein CVT24_006184 [Panaeolus cyanescens]
MSESMSYTTPDPYLSAHPSYYPPPTNAPIHIVPPPQRSEVAARKRPKYTRSKTGCMTCRVKKIKCDETKPNCMRCTHGSRECSWPEGVPVRKKAAAKRDSVDIDGRPSTAGSSGLSESSTPPTREHSPPRRGGVDLNLLPLSSRPSNDNYMHLHSLTPEHDSARRQLDRSAPYSHHSNPNVLSMIPESSYPSRGYDHGYIPSPHQQSRHAIHPSSYRTLSHPSAHHWNATPEPLDPYVSHISVLMPFTC